MAKENVKVSVFVITPPRFPHLFDLENLYFSVFNKMAKTEWSFFRLKMTLVINHIGSWYQNRWDAHFILYNQVIRRANPAPEVCSTIVFTLFYLQLRNIYVYLEMITHNKVVKFYGEKLFPAATCLTHLIFPLRFLYSMPCSQFNL